MGSAVPSGRSHAQLRQQRDEQGDKVSPDLRERLQHGQSVDETISVILQLNGHVPGQLNALLNRNGIHVKAQFEAFNSMAVDLPLSVVDELALYDEVEFVSGDSPIESFGHVTNTTGAEMVRAQTTAAGAAYTLDGTGVGIAILDSGLYLEPDPI